MYHTPYLVDLVSRGSLVIPDLDIPVPERFINPGQREHLYVPGSEKATVSVVGKINMEDLYDSELVNEKCELPSYI